MAKQILTLEIIRLAVDKRVKALLASDYEHRDVQAKKWNSLLKHITKGDVDAAAKKLDIDTEQVVSFFSKGQIYAVQKVVSTLIAVGRADLSHLNQYDRHILSLFKGGKASVDNETACKSIVSKLSKGVKTASTQRSSSAKAMEALGVLTAGSQAMTINPKSTMLVAMTVKA